MPRWSTSKTEPCTEGVCFATNPSLFPTQWVKTLQTSDTRKCHIFPNHVNLTSISCTRDHQSKCPRTSNKIDIHTCRRISWTIRCYWNLENKRSFFAWAIESVVSLYNVLILLKLENETGWSRKFYTCMKCVGIPLSTRPQSGILHIAASSLTVQELLSKDPQVLSHEME